MPRGPYHLKRATANSRIQLFSNEDWALWKGAISFKTCQKLLFWDGPVSSIFHRYFCPHSCNDRVLGHLFKLSILVLHSIAVLPNRARRSGRAEAKAMGSDIEGRGFNLAFPRCEEQSHIWATISTPHTDDDNWISRPGAQDFSGDKRLTNQQNTSQQTNNRQYFDNCQRNGCAIKSEKN